MDEPRESWAPTGDFASAMARANLAAAVPGLTDTITVMSGNDGAVDYTPLAGVLSIMQTHSWPNSTALMQDAYAAGKPNWFYNTGGDLRMVYGFFQYKYGRGNGAWEWHLDWMDAQMFDPWPYSPFNNQWRYWYPSPNGPVPTIDYELASQGISDYRYLATLDRLVTEANASGDPEMVDRATAAQALLTAVRNDTPAFTVDNGYIAQHFAGLSSTAQAEVAIENYRQQVADMIGVMLGPRCPTPSRSPSAPPILAASPPAERPPSPPRPPTPGSPRPSLGPGMTVAPAAASLPPRRSPIPPTRRTPTPRTATKRSPCRPPVPRADQMS